LRYRPDIDGLRAVAVLSVVAFHAFPDYLTGGFVGVDVFFVISGYLITSILVKQHREAKFSFGDFYSRRARRILPALCLVLLACLLFGYLALLPDEFANLGRHMAAAAAFAANLSFWREAGYFAPASEFQPLLHLWSLGIEEQFYLLWPLVLAFAWRRRFNILQVVLFLTAASFAANLVLTHIDSTAAFYFPLSRFWQVMKTPGFAGGCSRAGPWFSLASSAIPCTCGTGRSCHLKPSCIPGHRGRLIGSPRSC